MWHHLLGIDLGTSRVKVVLVDESGEILGSGKQGLSTFLTPQPGWVEQDPQSWWAGNRKSCPPGPDRIKCKGSHRGDRDQRADARNCSHWTRGTASVSGGDLA